MKYKCLIKIWNPIYACLLKYSEAIVKCLDFKFDYYDFYSLQVR